MEAHRVLIRRIYIININNEAYMLNVNVGILLKKCIICETKIIIFIFIIFIIIIFIFIIFA